MKSRLFLALVCALGLLNTANGQPPPLIYSDGPPPLAVAPDGQPPRNRPIQRAFNNIGLACWSHHTEMGCGSFRSEFGFVFGSCRYFYGDRCIPNPPHNDRDPYWRNPCASGKCNQDR